MVVGSEALLPLAVVDEPEQDVIRGVVRIDDDGVEAAFATEQFDRLAALFAMSIQIVAD